MIIPFIEFAVPLIGLGLAARIIPGLAGFINWFFLFPLTILTFGTLAYCVVWIAFGFTITLASYALTLAIVGLPIGIGVTVVANS